MVGYRVSAVMRLGGAVSVIVDSIDAARLQAKEYRDAGFADVSVTDLEGRAISIPGFAEGKPA